MSAKIIIMTKIINNQKIMRTQKKSSHLSQKSSGTTLTLVEKSILATPICDDLIVVANYDEICVRLLNHLQLQPNF